MDKIFFNGWEGLARTFIISILAYIALIFLLRISGKRTLSKMNAFDFIVTIALGSTLATILLNKEVALAEGVTALGLLIFLQYIITYFSARVKGVSRLVKSTPSLLVYKGKMLRDIMRKERIDEDEIHAIIRENGLSSIEQADAIVLETDGSLSLISKVADFSNSTFENIKKPKNIY